MPTSPRTVLDSSEQWRVVPSLPRITVSNLGYILRDGKPIAISERGRVYIGNRKTRQLGRLVLEAFVGPCPDGMECCHYDDNPFNNKLTNLRYDTPSANKRDRARNSGRWGGYKGEKNGRSKLTESDVVEIRALRLDGWKKSWLAKKFGVDRKTIHCLLLGINWSHVK